MPRGIGGGWTFDDIQPEVAVLPGDEAVGVDGKVGDDSNGVGRGETSSKYEQNHNIVIAMSELR